MRSTLPEDRRLRRIVRGPLFRGLEAGNLLIGWLLHRVWRLGGVGRASSTGPLDAFSAAAGDRVLVLAPHPDDESAGLGATLSAFARAGIEVHVALLGDGRDSQAPMLRDLDAEARGRWRVGEMQRALSCLDERIVWHRPFDRASGQSPDEPVGDGTDALAAVFRQVAPTLLFVPPPFDFHPDHRAAAARASKLCAAASSRQPTELWYYEVHAPFGPFEPTVYVELDADSVRRKEAALDAHGSQRHLFDAIHRLGRLRATLCGAAGPVEAFVKDETMTTGDRTTRGLTNRPHADWAVLMRRWRSSRRSRVST